MGNIIDTTRLSEALTGFNNNIKERQSVVAETNQAITSRVAGGSNAIEDGVASYAKIKGNALVWNQLWQNVGIKTDNSCTYVVNDNGSLTITSLNSNPHIYIASTIRANHKYIVQYSSSNGTIRSTMIGGVFVYVTDQKYAFATIGATVSNKNVVLYFTDLEEAFTIDNVTLTDLTQMFGAGNEPTTYEDFLARKPKVADEYAYKAGDLLPNKATQIKTSGRNLFNGKFEHNKIFNTSTGEMVATSYDTYASVDYVPVEGGKTYYLLAKDYGCILYYTKDKGYLGADSILYFSINGMEFTPPTNAGYLRFYGNALIKDGTCINLSDASFNGTYEPYEEHSLLVDFTAIKDNNGNSIFPDGGLAAGEIYDEQSKSGAVKRIGCVDLGSLTWTYRSDVLCFQSEALDTMKSINWSALANFLCPLYSLMAAQKQYSQKADVDKVVGIYNQQIWITDKSYNGDAAAFKTAMSGVYSYYELATPTEISYADYPQDFGTERQIDIQVFAGGREWMESDGNSAPIVADISYYKSNIKDSIFAQKAQESLSANYAGFALNSRLAEMATRLASPITLWGRTFDGSANITDAPDLYIGNNKVTTTQVTQALSGISSLTMSGALSGATTGAFSSNVSVGGTLGVTGATTLSSTLSVSGNIGVNQSAGTGTGISLYGGTGNVWSYGLAFALTSSKGKWGSVTGDWATYFTMNGANTRGWLFKHGTTFAASLSGAGDFQTLGSIKSNGLVISNGTKQVTLSIDEDGYLKIDGGMYATSFISAGGLSTTSGGSSGVSYLAELSDVTITNPAASQLLQYNGSNWVNVAASSISVGTATNASQLGGVAAANYLLSSTAASTYQTKITSDNKLAYSLISGTPTIPTNNNQLTNGAGYITSSGSCNYATSAGSASYANYLNLVSTNEFRFGGKPSSATEIYVGYKWADGTSSALISSYRFCSGAGNNLVPLYASTFYSSSGTEVSYVGHTHSYLPLSGGTMTGDIKMSQDVVIANANGKSCLHAQNAYTLLGYGTSADGKPTYIDGNDIYFRYGTSHTTGMFFNSSGNLSIGTTTSEGRFKVVGSDSSASTINSKFANSAGTGLLYIFNDGKVGIGTNSPICKLDINGDVNSTGYFGSNINSSVTSDYKWGLYQWGNFLTLTQRDSSGTFKSNVMVYNLTNGNVGIGNNNPSYKLHVDGSIYATGKGTYLDEVKIQRNNGESTPQLTFAINGSYNTSAGTILFQSGSYNGLKLCSEYAAYAARQNFCIYTSNNTTDPYGSVWAKSFVIKYDGCVGINVPDPQHKLHIEGDIYIHKGQLYINSDGNLGYAGNIYANTSVGLRILAPASSDIQTKYPINFGFRGDSTNYMTLASNGCLGIGTESPISKLEVAGSIALSPYGKNIASGNAGWYRVYLSRYADNTVGWAFITVGHSYSYSRNETYTFCVNISYNGEVTITQVSGCATSGAVQIPQVRVAYNSSSNWAFEVYVNASVTRNTYYTNCIGYGSSVNFELQTATPANSVVMNTISGIGTSKNIVAVGGVTSGYSSDARFKDNVHALVAYENVLKTLRPVEFDWNELARSKDDTLVGHDAGLIAQEVKGICPTLVTPIYNDYFRVDYARLTPYLVAGWQSHESRIERLERENEELRNRIKELEE